MDKLRRTILVALLPVVGLTMPIRAKTATTNEALTVANNWINAIIQKKGSWGDANSAFVEEIKEFKRDERLLGYFCRVSPKGYIIVSLRKELAPVKAYSATGNINPECDDGVARYVGDCMERILDRIEKEIGPVHLARTEDVSMICEINYQSIWAELEKDEDEFEKGLVSGMIAMNYQSGNWLLTTGWEQGDPYNQQCPVPPSGDDCDRPRCSVGCVATAAAQIMRYWCWPPYGLEIPIFGDTYDWVRMANWYVWDGAEYRWEDEYGNPLSQAHLDAVAELSHEIGIAVGMDYCSGDKCASGVDTFLMEAVYEGPYRYSDSCCKLDRVDYDSDGWFNEIKIQLNSNQPIQYRVPGHSTVVDGWQVVLGREIHINYGWAGGHPDKPCWKDYTDTNTWYLMDAIPCSDPDEEYMMVNIFPVTSVRHAIAGTYPKEGFNYRYFNQDASGSSAIFEAGQNLQFLPNIVVSSTGTIKFGGNSRFFTRGDTSRGIRTDSGGISLYSGGQMKLY